MKNIQLNPGGLIGAVLCMAGAIGGAMLAVGPDQMSGPAARYGVIALFAGAFGGNFLWERLFGNRR